MIEKIKKFLKNKRTKVLNASSKNLQKLEFDWNKFNEDDLYLEYSIKEGFLAEAKKGEEISKIPWYLFFDRVLREEIKQNLNKLRGYPKIINSYNKRFVKQKISEYSPLFSKSPYPLDRNQKKAVIKDDKHNLVVAGAGSGKTETLITRIAYLIKRKSKPIKTSRILALAFQNKAAKEMSERLKERYGLNVEVRTFHSLGNKVLEELAETSGKNPPKLKFGGENGASGYHNFIDQLFRKKESTPEFKKKLIKYLKYFGDEEKVKKEKDFERKEEYSEYMKNLRYTALDGTKVKSEAEREIMNFFITHNLNGKKIKALYEAKAEWMEYLDPLSEKLRIPCPDFFFPDFDIYLEHWAIDNNGRVPAWFEKDNYLETMELKKNKFLEQEKYSLVETKSSDYLKGNFNNLIKGRLLNVLKDKFPDKEFLFEELGYKELIERVWNGCSESVKLLSSKIADFIIVAKTYNLRPEGLRRNLGNGCWSKRQLSFGEIALEIFKDYEGELHGSNQIDFPDMINLAVNGLRGIKALYENKFDHILVDEYQDISTQRYNLIKSLMEKNDGCHLFCVGDDWQSIMGFTGSNLNFFVKFRDYFNHPERTDLEVNYRSIKSIVDTGAEIIKNNGDSQLKKRAIAHDEEVRKIKVYSSKFGNSNWEEIKRYYEQVSEHCMKKILEYRERGYPWGEIMILRRINPPGGRMTNILNSEAQKLKIPLSEDTQNPNTVSLITVHKSKGLQAKVVFILNVDKGLYGFPNELQSPDILEPATEGKNEDKEEEERRLFYVAVTRAKEDVIIYHQGCSKSKFLDEIKTHVKIEEI